MRAALCVQSHVLAHARETPHNKHNNRHKSYHMRLRLVYSEATSLELSKIKTFFRWPPRFFRVPSFENKKARPSRDKRESDPQESRIAQRFRKHGCKWERKTTRSHGADDTVLPSQKAVETAPAAHGAAPARRGRQRPHFFVTAAAAASNASCCQRASRRCGGAPTTVPGGKGGGRSCWGECEQ